MRIALFDTSFEILTLTRLIFRPSQGFEVFFFQDEAPLQFILTGQQRYDAYLFYVNQARLGFLQSLAVHKDKVFVYADSTAELLEACDSGFNHAALKPFSPSFFEDTIRKIMNQSSSSSSEEERRIELKNKEEKVLEEQAKSSGASGVESPVLNSDHIFALRNAEDLVRSWLEKEAPSLTREIIRRQLTEIVQEAQKLS